MKFDGKEELVKKVQSALKLKIDGDDGSITWNAIVDYILGIEETRPVPATPAADDRSPLSDKAYNLILKYEVGGGSAYYNKALKHPCYPGGASGVTIGIGYDLGYNTKAQFANDWKSVISDKTFSRLEACLGSKSTLAKQLIRNVKDIEIDWESASVVFKKETLPRFINETLKAFPNADSLHPDAFGALVSIVFNRGASVSGSSRAEMANIRALIPSKNYKKIAQEIRNMKRLWVGKGLDGLLKRRDEEASLVESCI
jgi:GH24 family phage-related lysozyme (muramidase)